MTFDEFLKHTQILRMLYGERIAREYYENNVNAFYNQKVENLLNYKSSDTIELTK